MGSEVDSEEDATFDWTDEELDAYEMDAFSGDTPENHGNRGEAAPCTSQSKLVSHFVGMGFSLAMVTKAIDEKGEDNAEAVLEALLTDSNLEPGTSQSKVCLHFTGMGFSQAMVSKAIEENGEENIEAVLETLLTYSVLDDTQQEHSTHANSNSCLDEEDCEDNGFSDVESSVADEEMEEFLDEKERKLLFLVEMGYDEDEATLAITRSGENASVIELQDMISAARMAKESDADFDELHFSSSDIDEEKPSYDRPSLPKRRREWVEGPSVYYKAKKKENKVINVCKPSTHMIGFGVPNDPFIQTSRNLPDAAIGLPFFYYENVALAPKNVWETISHHLYGIEPEFVDSKYFCAAARKRGYIHNLPIDNRFPLEPRAPLTIQEALPLTRKWWPSWDDRIKLCCIQTCIASSKTTDKIRVALSESSDPPPLNVQKYVIHECKKWNLVWVGRHKVAPLEPDEIEKLLGFPKNHTRGVSRTDRYRSLGNSFQLDTVAYHLSVLKNMFPNGIRVLSLFSGIGGAEVALHQLGIFLKVVVTVEISEASRNIFKSWWDLTEQRGQLFDDITDVRELSAKKLEDYIIRFGGFDLVVGGSPCNNISGSNRVSRDGLEGKHSSLFFDYSRILDDVKRLMN